MKFGSQCSVHVPSLIMVHTMLLTICLHNLLPFVKNDNLYDFRALDQVIWSQLIETCSQYLFP